MLDLLVIERDKVAFTYKTALYILAMSAILCGCASTYIDGPKLGSDYIRLAAANRKNITVSITGSSTETTLGHQFIFVLFPIGTIYSSNPEQLFTTAVYRTLAENSYNPTVIGTDSHTTPALSLRLENISATAYDLFFFRIVSCSIDFNATDNRTMNTIKIHGYSSTPRLKGFKPQLEACLEEASTEGSNKLISEFNL